MNNQEEIMQKLYSASALLEYLETSLSALLGTHECRCEHYILESARKKITDSIKLL